MLDLKSILLHLLNLGVLIVGVRLLAYKPVVRFLDERKKRFADERAEIDRAHEEAAHEKSVYENMIDVVRSEAERLRFQRIVEAEEQAKQVSQSAREQADRMLAEARERIAAEEAEAREGMRDEAVDMAIMLAERILQREVNSQDNRHLIEEFLKKVE